MNPIPTKPKQKDQVVNVRQVEVEKQQKLVGRIIPKKGHTIWEVNIKEHTVEPATFEDQDVTNFSKEKKSRGFGAIDLPHGGKKIVLDLPQVHVKKVVKKKYCIYVSALNKKNLYKKLEKFGLVKILKRK